MKVYIQLANFIICVGNVIPTALEYFTIVDYFLYMKKTD